MELAQQVAELKTVILSLVLIGGAGMLAMNILARHGDKPANPSPSTPTYYCRKHGCPEAECAERHSEGNDE